MTQSNQQPASNTTDQDLVDLQPDRQSMIKRILAPKIIILTFLSLIFISRNIYYGFINPTIQPQKPQNIQPHDVGPIKQDDSIMGRLYGYVILSFVLLVLYILCVRANDRALLRKIQEEKAKRKQMEKQKQQENLEKNKQVSEDSRNKQINQQKNNKGQ